VYEANKLIAHHAGGVLAQEREDSAKPAHKPRPSPKRHDRPRGTPGPENEP
jgi:hypothetical protein